MEFLEQEQLAEINGGISNNFWFILGGIGTFLAGLFAGFLNPLKCNG